MFIVNANTNRLPALFLQDYKPLDEANTVFRINASFPAHVVPTGNQLADMFAVAVDSKLAILAGTVDEVGEYQHSRVITFLAAANIVSRSIEGLEDKVTCVTANVFLDQDDQTLWNMIGEGKDRRLVQASKEDLAALLHSRLARRQGTMITASAVPFNHGIKPDVLDFASFYNHNTGRIDYGFALPIRDGSVLCAALNQDGKLVKVSPLAIVDTANISRQPDGLVPDRIKTHMRQSVAILATGLPMSSEPVLDPTEADFTEPMANTFLTYWASLYKGTTFFNTLSDLIARRRSIAREGAPLTTMKTV